jgi:hypothetical protein
MNVRSFGCYCIKVGGLEAALMRPTTYHTLHAAGMN